MNNTQNIPAAIRIITALLGPATWTGMISKDQAATWSYPGGTIGLRYTPRNETLVSVWQKGAKAPTHMLHHFDEQGEASKSAEELELLEFLRAVKGVS